MATNLDIDDKLIDQARRIGKHKTKKEAVTNALIEYIKARKRLALLDWVGKVEYFDDVDHKKMRRRKTG
jgi:Arc/MetJ family transcription regulator